MVRNAQDRRWSDVMPAKRQTRAWPPAERNKAGRWADMARGGREKTRPRAREALQPASDRPGVLASGGGASQPTKAVVQRMAWRVI